MDITQVIFLNIWGIIEKVLHLGPKCQHLSTLSGWWFTCVRMRLNFLCCQGWGHNYLLWMGTTAPTVKQGSLWILKSETGSPQEGYWVQEAGRKGDSSLDGQTHLQETGAGRCQWVDWEWCQSRGFWDGWSWGPPFTCGLWVCSIHASSQWHPPEISRVMSL